MTAKRKTKIDFGDISQLNWSGVLSISQESQRSAKIVKIGLSTIMVNIMEPSDHDLAGFASSIKLRKEMLLRMDMRPNVPIPVRMSNITVMDSKPHYSLRIYQDHPSGVWREQAEKVRPVLMDLIDHSLILKAGSDFTPPILDLMKREDFVERCNELILEKLKNISAGVNDENKNQALFFVKENFFVTHKNIFASIGSKLDFILRRPDNVTATPWELLPTVITSLFDHDDIMSAQLKIQFLKVFPETKKVVAVAKTSDANRRQIEIFLIAATNAHLVWDKTYYYLPRFWAENYIHKLDPNDEVEKHLKEYAEINEEVKKKLPLWVHSAMQSAKGRIDDIVLESLAKHPFPTNRDQKYDYVNKVLEMHKSVHPISIDIYDQLGALTKDGVKKLFNEFLVQHNQLSAAEMAAKREEENIVTMPLDTVFEKYVMAKLVKIIKPSPIQINIGKNYTSTLETPLVVLNHRNFVALDSAYESQISSAGVFREVNLAEMYEDKRPGSFFAIVEGMKSENLKKRIREDMLSDDSPWRIFYIMQMSDSNIQKNNLVKDLDEFREKVKELMLHSKDAKMV